MFILRYSRKALRDHGYDLWVINGRYFGVEKCNAYFRTNRLDFVCSRLSYVIIYQVCLLKYKVCLNN